MGRILVLALALVAGCYRAVDYERCSLACGPGGECPGALVCNTEQRCAASSDDSCVGADAGMMPDSSASDDGFGSASCSRWIDKLCVSGSGVMKLSGMFDTSECMPVIQTGGGPYCLVTADTIEISLGQTFTATGTMPIAFAATNIAIDGTLDVSSTASRSGAGADDAACALGVLPTMAAGGAGGSFGTVGGQGGDARSSVDGGQPAAASASPTLLHGGCPGQAGATTTAPGGAGGGGVWLFATATIAISGEIDAGGAGGTSVASAIGSGGGGGGGAGGMIGIEAPAITLMGSTLAANGGGGGGGNAKDLAGGNGSDGAQTAAASGGAGAQDGSMFDGSGGSGAFADSAGKLGSSAAPAGGGGGGGEGAIYVKGTIDSMPAQCSPTAM
ncbi:MAG TPA: hypothetical protein VMJ10_36060 [Kofleriaceae bacterium]|nr:hypothetical protein [Kofleriaceae bacterium]